MISITGTVIGELTSLVFIPSLSRFIDPDGEPIVSEHVYAQITNSNYVATISVQLKDNTEMLADETWFWVGCETASSGKQTLFTVPSDWAVYRYTDIRPVEGT